MIKKLLGLLLAALLLWAGAAAGSYAMQNYVVYDWKVYPKGLPVLDLRDQLITQQDRNELAAMLPGTTILWNVPFQGFYIPSDTRELQIDFLMPGDLGIIESLEYLEKVDGYACEDYAELALLYKLCPSVRVEYAVPISGQLLESHTETVVLTEITEEDIALLACLPRLKTVDASQCRDASLLQAAAEAHPSWNVLLPDGAE